MSSFSAVGRALSALVLALAGLAGHAAAQLQATAAASAASAPPAAIRLARDLHEEVHRIPVTVSDLSGRRESVEIALTSFRPDGPGPFPLVVMSHGRGKPEVRRQLGRVRYDVLARYFVNKGLAVLVPTRVGYGDTYGNFDPEDAGSCATLRADQVSAAASDQVLATIDYARSLPWADTRRWIAAGQSVGGLATMAVAARNPPGLVATINFSGGTGGVPDLRPGRPCAPQNIESLWRGQAASAKTPSLWFYWENDRLWGAEVPRRWARAWEEGSEGGGGKLSFHQLPAAGKDGHGGLSQDMDHWMPIAEAWLAKLGFDRPGDVPVPPPSGFAAIDDVQRVPISAASRARLYARFLAAPKPRAFAIGRRGGVAWSSGDWARGRALGACNNVRIETCVLYAVDDEVVWPADDPTPKRE